MVLDAAYLDAIVQEARSCFLYEDAPDYLAILEQGIARLLDPTREKTAIAKKGEYTDLMRAAHSIKGGAGIAQLPSLNQLAHKLEDLLQALHEGRVPAQVHDCAYELLALGVEQVKDLVAIATTDPSSAIATDPTAIPLVVTLNDFIQDLPQQTSHLENSPEGNQPSAINPFILKSALEFDLEDCLQRVEELLKQPIRPRELKQGLTNFVEECTLLGQTLNLAWLVDTADTVERELTQTKPELENIAKTAISQMRQLRSQTLNPTPQHPPAQTIAGEQRGRGAEENEQSKISYPKSKIDFPQHSTTPAALNLRVPVTRLDRMNNTLGELLISYQRLSLYKSNLDRANSALKQQAKQLNPINEQVRVFYDQLATSLTSPLAATTNSLALSAEEGFDSLHFDRYTAFHTTLQSFQELMVRVQEIRSDIDLISRDFHEGLEQLRKHLNSLRGDLTQSRLVPFKFLAERFVAPLQSLNQRYHKSVELVIVGKETLVDQVILEQLQTPLTHLLRNAFDHGIETAKERLALGKPEIAQITLSAAIQGNQVTIAIADDGRGIDVQKVYNRAVSMGLCQADASPSKEHLELMFMPGFSTATAVTDLSGRGVGLDVVRLQVERLRGSIQVETELQQGSKFAIAIPLTLSILPLLLCRCQQRTLAIPSSDILEIIALAEFIDSSSSDAITWKNQRARLFSLTQLLPYTRKEGFGSSKQLHQKLGIVLNVGGETVVVAVDSLLGEKELVLKPFDATVTVPSYITGCTVLGTGEVVPVLFPSHLSELIAQIPPQQPLSSEFVPPKAGMGADTNPATILIVDDSVAVRRLLSGLLSQAGYQVVQCRDGKEALETLNSSGERYDLVISDIEMPRLDGFGLLKEIRSHSRWNSLPIAMLTSRENDQHRQKAKQLGANSYFTKPFQPSDLLSAIATFLA